jgi:hypothetical protein
MTRFFKTFVHPRRSETVVELARRLARSVKLQEHLTALDFNGGIAVADDYAAIEIIEA